MNQQIVARLAELLAFVLCLHDEEFNEDLLSCKPLSTLTTSDETFWDIR
jgi:hypothetical protein